MTDDGDIQLDARRQFQRLRNLFLGPSNNERKSTISLSTSSLVPILDVNTFVNAAQDKDTDTLHKYLLAGFPPDQPDPSTKATALHVAVESANIRAVQMLIQAGAQINAADISSSTPLHIAAYMGYEEIVQMLLSHGADMYKQDNTGRNSFHLAVSSGNIRLIQHFISTADTEHSIIHKPDAQNWTPLMCACASNHPTICAFLLSYNADLCATNDRHMTAFHIAAFLGSLPVLQELLTSSSSSSSNDEIILKALNQGDNRNQTPLFYACIEGHLDVALTLLRAGANAYHLDNNDQTCLHAMISSTIMLKRHIRLFYCFIQYVDYRHNQDNLGRTLLDLAYVNQLKSIIYLLILLNYKANPDIIFDNEQIDNRTYQNDKQILSLRHICILHFKHSIIYHRNQRQSTQHDLLENALKQIFHIESNKNLLNLKENNSNDYSPSKSLDDISLLQQQQHSTKYQKNVKSTKNQDKKMRKTSTIFSTTTSSSSSSSSTNKWPSQIDLQPTHSTWSVLTHKLKGQRLLPTPTNTPQIALRQQTNSVQSSRINPMTHLALKILTSPKKLHSLLDFPSLNNNQLVNEDLKMSMIIYNLLDTNSSN
ncbi:unnamed protein product [Adineta steineri]|uniref:Uncharacterized protein n=1 Tax=Adineta steineri TaxID=433720 RepID=A0A814RUF7_9BILA|nr:unnamed protein product [Adineta steineri]